MGTLPLQREETMGHETVVKAIANAVQARISCKDKGNTEWFEKHTERIEQLTDFLPSGSGFDCGTKIDLDASHADKLVFQTSYHHMNDAGYYDGWTEHTVVVTPSFIGMNIRVSGRNRNDVKDYIGDTFQSMLSQTITWITDRYVRAE